VRKVWRIKDRKKKRGVKDSLTVCGPCTAEDSRLRAAEYRKTKPDVLNARTAAWRLKKRLNDPEYFTHYHRARHYTPKRKAYMQTEAVKAKRKAQFERWYYADVDGNRLRAKRYYWADPEKSWEANRERLKKYYDKNPAQFKDYAAKRRGLRNGARGSHTTAEFEELKKAFGYRC